MMVPSAPGLAQGQPTSTSRTISLNISQSASRLANVKDRCKRQKFGRSSCLNFTVQPYCINLEITLLYKQKTGSVLFVNIKPLIILSLLIILVILAFSTSINNSQHINQSKGNAYEYRGKLHEIQTVH